MDGRVVLLAVNDAFMAEVWFVHSFSLISLLVIAGFVVLSFS